MNALAAVLAFLALIAAARARLTATVFGQPVSVPVLGLVVLAAVLALAVALVVLLRSIVRDWPRRVTA